MRRLLILCLAVSLAGAWPLVRGELGEWPFEGTRLDASGNGHTGYGVNTVYTTGVFGQCDSFNGTTAYDSVGHLDCNTAMTICAWIRPKIVAVGPQEVVANCDVTGNQGDYSLEINRTAAKVAANWGNALILRSKSSLTAGTWTHVAFVRSGSAGAWTVSIYLNAVLDTTTTTAVNPNGSNALTCIGRAGSVPVFWYTGLVDNVIIFTRALSVRDIQRVMMGMSPIE